MSDFATSQRKSKETIRGVSLKPMKQIFTALFVLAISSTGIAATPAADVGDHLMSVIRDADSVSIEFYSRAGKEEVSFVDPFWVERLAAALAFASYKPQSHCFCVSYPTIRLRRGKEVIGTLSVHHGDKLRAYAGKVSGDFMVGAKTGQTVIDLANDKKRAEQDLRPKAF